MPNEIDILIKVQDKTAPGTASAQKNAEKLKKEGGHAFEGFGDKAKMASIAVGGAMALAAKSIVGAASDSQQSLGGTQAVFGKYADVVIAKSKKASDAVGLSANDYRESANIIGSLFKNQGVAADQLSVKTDKMIKMGADLSATYGGTAKEAVEALSSAFKGEFDPMERYGISLKQSTINAEAMAVANVKTQKAFDKLTPAAQAAAKQTATMNILNKQGKDAAGQFQKQTSTLAEKQQILKAKVTDLAASFGDKLLPAVAGVLDKGVKMLAWMEKNPAVVKAVAVAVGGLTVILGTLALVLAVNPAVIMVAGLYALAVACGVAWAKSAKFRDIVTSAFTEAASETLTSVRMMLEALHHLSDGVLNMVIGILHALGKIPGNDWADRAAKDVEGFKRHVDDGFDKAIQKTRDWQNAVERMPKIVRIKSDIADLVSKLNAAKARLRDKHLTNPQRTKIRADIHQLQQRVALARATLNALRDRVVHVTVVTHRGTHAAPSEMMAHGGIVGAAASGGPRSGFTMVGEYGRELVKLAPGSQVYPHGTTEAMMARAGGGVARVELEWVGGNGGDDFLKWLRKNIRGRGGNVQLVLGP